MTAYIGYENLFLDGTVTATSEATGYDIENALDWLTYDYWQATSTSDQTVTVVLSGAQSCDFIGLTAHNFDTSQPDIYFERWNGSTWVQVDTCSPTTLDPIFRVFTSVSATQYRFRFASAAAAVQVGVLCAGEVLTMPRGVQASFTPLALSQTVEYIDNMSDGGQWLGRSKVAGGIEGSLDFHYLEPAWIRNSFQPFRIAARSQGFFWGWDLDTYPDEVAYLWLTQEPRPVYFQNGFDLMNVSLQVRGTWDDV